MAISQHDANWQSTKNTVLERSRHMFDNPFLSDVVLSCEGSDKKFFAHKYVLATSSAVFYAMFYGKLAEKNSVVNLSDTSEEILEEFLRFLYTDECNLTTDNAMFVLYLAKKYIVPSLVEICIEFLVSLLTPENVFVVLKQAMQFNEEKLVNKCWNQVDLQAKDAVASHAFADISQSTLEMLLKRESLQVKEVDLFKGVLKWSEAECLRKGIEANAKNKRDVIGNAIYQIRFASMASQEFSLIASQSDILTSEEIILFYHNISGVKVASDVWNLSERGAEEKALLRCCRFNGYCVRVMPTGTRTTESTLCVSFSKPVNLHGVRLLGDNENEYDVKFQVFSQSVEAKFRSHFYRREVSGFDVMLPVPIKVQPDDVVQLKAIVKLAYFPPHCPFHPNFYSGCKGTEAVKINGMTVNFFNTPGVQSSYTTVELGQFDEIIFSEV